MKDRKKTIALLLCVCVEFDTPEEFKIKRSGCRKITDQYKENENGITY